MIDPTTGEASTAGYYWGGAVWDMELTNDRLYVAGEFTGYSTNIEDANTGTSHGLMAFEFDWPCGMPQAYPVDWDPPLDGPVYVIRDHQGYLYAGGGFHHVGTEVRQGLARFDGAGWLTGWAPPVTGFNFDPVCEVHALRGIGSTMYVGGFNIHHVGNVERRNAAAISTVTGEVLPWNPSPNAGIVAEIVDSWGAALIAGSFSEAAEAQLPGLASFLTPEGCPTGFRAKLVSGIGHPNCLLLVGDTLFIGGSFSFTDTLGQTGPTEHVAALDAVSGERLDWNVDVDWVVDDMVYADGILYLGGSFHEVNGQTRHGLAAVHAATGALASWAPLTAGEASWDMELVGDTIYVSGSAMTDGMNSGHLIAVDRITGDFLPWAPQVDGLVRKIKFHQGRLFVGGQIYHVGGQPREIAEVDPVSGALYPWHVDANESADIYDLEVHGNTMFIGGTFTGMGGAPRNGLAAVHLSTGLATSWDPGMPEYGSVYALAIADDLLYVGGALNAIVGVQRTALAVFELPPVQTDQVAASGGLEGAYNGGTGLNNDGLRTLSSFPLTEPYTGLGYAHVSGGGESINPAILGISGDDAIVDWVVLELRSPASPGTIVESRSGLLQRDGDIVTVDGVSPVGFTSPPGLYHVALRHRNHLGIMTQDPVPVGPSAPPVDFFSASTPVWGTNARKTVGSAQVLWSGDVNFDHQLRYTGTNNDRDPILQRIGGIVPTSIISGYLPEDVNMDGVVKYTGTGNDRDLILQNIGGVVPTNVRIGQLP